MAVVDVLLDKEADINQIKNDGESPLHKAAYYGHEAVVAVLLAKGVKVNQANNDGQKPIDVADTQKIKDMLIAHMKKKQEQEWDESDVDSDEFVHGEAEESHWFQAAEKGDLALIQQGIDDKIDVNCQDSDGCTALYWAAEKGHLQLVEYLITQHADLHIADVSAANVF